MNLNRTVTARQIVHGVLYAGIGLVALEVRWIRRYYRGLGR